MPCTSRTCTVHTSVQREKKIITEVENHPWAIWTIDEFPMWGAARCLKSSYALWYRSPLKYQTWEAVGVNLFILIRWYDSLIWLPISTSFLGSPLPAHTFSSLLLNLHPPLLSLPLTAWSRTPPREGSYPRCTQSPIPSLPGVCAPRSALRRGRRGRFVRHLWSVWLGISMRIEGERKRVPEEWGKERNHLTCCPVLSIFLVQGLVGRVRKIDFLVCPCHRNHHRTVVQ